MRPGRSRPATAGPFDYLQLNGERREPLPQEEPSEPEPDPLPRALNREIPTREELPPQAGHASFDSSERRLYASNTFRHDSHRYS
jgi:hypothetical protein